MKLIQRCLPSDAGVAELKLFSPCFFSRSETRRGLSQRTLPELRSMERSLRSCLSSRQVERKMRSLITMGEEWPLPGMEVFQRMFSVLFHLRGRFFSEEMPSPLGPRQAGHSSAKRKLDKDKNAVRKRKVRCMLGNLQGKEGQSIKLMNIS